MRFCSVCAAQSADSWSPAGSTQGFELFAALGHQLVIVNSRGGSGVKGQGVGCGHRADGKEQYKKESKASGLPKVLILGFKAGV